MAGFNGTGTYVLNYDWPTDKANAVAVTASRMQTEFDGVATGLSTCIAKDGQTVATARIPFALGLSLGTGTVAAPAINFTSDTNTGVYSIGSDNIGVACNGIKILDVSTSGLAVAGLISTTGQLTVTGVATFNSSVGIASDVLVNTNKFIIAGATGNTSTAGTLDVTGALTVASGNFNIGSNFSVVNASGNTVVRGTFTTSGATNSFSGAGTTASAANAFLDSSNILLKSTSSGKYKADVEDVGLQEALNIVNGARPIKYHSLAKADDPKRQHLGLIAEELAEVDPRLINFDADGNPDGVQYERFAVALCSVVSALAQRAGL